MRPLVPPSMRLVRASALVLAAAFLGACVTESGDTDTTSDEIVGGRQERGSTYDAVVAIYDPYYHAVLGSGALIAPNVVVTAEHFIEDLSAGDIEVRSGYDAAWPAHKYSVDRIERVTAEGSQSLVGYGADVAFLILKRNASATPLTMLDRPLDETDLGRSVRLVAYGETQAQVNVAFGRYRRSAPGLVTLVTGRPHVKALDPATPAPAQGTPVRDGYEAEVEGIAQGFACSGDSGGPYIADIDGVLTVVGLQSAQSVSGHRCTAAFSIISSFGPEVQASKARALSQ